jgi:small subunit ribosomal protein S21
MVEVTMRRGEPVEKALRRLKKQMNREQTLVQVRLHRRFEKPSARKRRKQKAARFTAMLRARDAELQ